MARSNSSIRNFWVLLPIIIFIGFIFLLFYFGIVPDREKELNTRGFRILSRIEQNFLSKKIAKQKEIDNLFTQAKGDSIIKLLEDHIEDTTYNQPQNSNFRNTKAKIEFDNNQEKLQLNFNNNAIKKNSGNELKTYLKYVDNNGKWELRFFGVKNINNFHKDGKLCKPENSNEIIIEYKYSFDEFIEPLLKYRNDFFEDYIIFSDSIPVYQKNNFTSGLNFYKDSIQEHNKFISGQITEADLSGRKYKVFVKSFAMTDGLNLVLCGLISTDKYSTAKFKVHTYLAIIIIMSLIILLSSLPFVKILTISEYERFEKLDIWEMGLSSLLIGVSVLLLSFYFLYDNSKSSWNFRQVKSLNDSILLKFISEYNRNFKLLDDIDLNTGKYEDKESVKKEWIRISQEMGPGLNNIFLVDSAGLIELDYKYQAKNAIVEDNKFFTSAIQGDKDFFNIKELPQASRYLEIISNPFNDSISVILSKKRHISSSVIAAEFKLSSVMNPLIPENYGFCIIDQSGNVQFHKEQSRIQNENFISECNDEVALKAVIKNGDEKFLNLSFYGNDFYTYIQKIPDSPFFLITYLNKQPGYTSVSNIIIYSLTIYALVILSVIIIFILSYVICPKISYLKKPGLSFSFLNRNERNINAGKILIFTLLYTLFVYLLVSFIYQGEHLLYISIIHIFFTFLNVIGSIVISEIRIPNPIKNRLVYRCYVVIFLNLIAIILTSVFLDSKFNHLSVLIIYTISTGMLILILYKKYDSVIQFNHSFEYENIVPVLITFLIANTAVIPVVTLTLDGAISEYFYEHYKRKIEYDISRKQNANFRRTEYHLDYFEDRFTYTKFINSNYIGLVNYLHDSSKEYYINPGENSFSENDEENLNSDYLIDIFYRNFFYKLTTLFISVLFLFFLWISAKYIYKKIKLVEYFTGKNFPPFRLNHLDHYPLPGRKTLLIYTPGTQNVQTLINTIIQNLGLQISDFSSLDKYNCLHHNAYKLCFVSNNNLLFKDNINPGHSHRIFLKMLSDPEYSVIIFTNEDFYSIISRNISKVKNLKSSANEEVSGEEMYYNDLFEIFKNYNNVIFPLQPTNLFVNNHGPYINQLVLKEITFLVNASEIKSLLYKYLAYYKIQADVYAEDNEIIIEEKLFNKFPLLHEELIIKIKELCSPNYLAIWKSLSSGEKLILYDMAKDRIINYRNLTNLLLLKEKGILYYNEEVGTIELFNKSFSQFILTEVDIDEIEKLESEMKSGHTWKNTRTVIIILFLMTGLFIFLTRQEVFQKLSGFLVAVAAFIPLLIEIFKRRGVKSE